MAGGLAPGASPTAHRPRRTDARHRTPHGLMRPALHKARGLPATRKAARSTPPPHPTHPPPAGRAFGTEHGALQGPRVSAGADRPARRPGSLVVAGRPPPPPADAGAPDRNPPPLRASRRCLEENLRRRVVQGGREQAEPGRQPKCLARTDMAGPGPRAAGET